MNRRISFRPYRRPFRHPLRTSHGEWAVREGFIVRIEEEGHVGYGEVAPIPDFGTETTEAACGFLERVSDDPELSVPSNLPCCAFGLSSALSGVKCAGHLEVAALLPAGESVLNVATFKLGRGYRTLKWKIGVYGFSREKALFEHLVRGLPEGVRIRLDGNAGLSPEDCDRWLELLAESRGHVEFLEQPLPVGQERRMAELSNEMGVPIALDESLNDANGDCWLNDSEWSGPLVIKAPLMGDCAALIERLQPCAARVVWSSVFETPVGLKNAFALMQKLPASHFAIGYDTFGAFDDLMNPIESSPVISVSEVSKLNFDELWERLG